LIEKPSPGNLKTGNQRLTARFGLTGGWSSAKDIC